jgi:hypothetical protein
MKSLLVRSVFAVVCSGGALAACSANIHDNTLTVDHPNIAFTTAVDVNNVHPGQSVAVKITATNVFPVAPDKTPPPEHMQDAVFFKIFLDDPDSTELVVTASLSVSVTIPAATPPGSHKLICKTFSHAGEDTDSDTTIDINVTASVSTPTPPTAS